MGGFTGGQQPIVTLWISCLKLIGWFCFGSLYFKTNKKNFKHKTKITWLRGCSRLVKNQTSSFTGAIKNRLQHRLPSLSKELLWRKHPDMMNVIISLVFMFSHLSPSQLTKSVDVWIPTAALSWHTVWLTLQREALLDLLYWSQWLLIHLLPPSKNKQKNTKNFWKFRNIFCV